MKKTPVVSIIVLNWNGKRWLKECFSSIYKQDFKNFEVILADNNSSDNSIEYTRKNWYRVRILKLSKNFGYTGANNRAAKIAQGEFLLFLNNDTKVQRGFLRELYNVSKKKNVSLLAPRVFNYHGEDIYPKDKKYVGIGRFGYSGPSKNPFYVDGAALFIKKSIFKKLSGFDEDYFIFQEDVDISWRARLLGCEIYPVASAKVFHSFGGTLGGSKKNKKIHETSVFRRYHTEKNALNSLLKNYELKNIFYSVPVFLLLGWGEASLYFLSGRFSGGVAILKAHLWNISNIKNTFSKRKEIQKLRRVSDKQITKYMLKGCRKWEAFKIIGIPKFN